MEQRSRGAPSRKLRVIPRKRRLAKLAVFLLALPAILRASWRVTRLERRLVLDELVARLRTTRPFRLRALRHRPDWLLASLDRLLPLLPPRRYGRCLKRSLLLMDLWSRCGLSPRLHLGVRRADEDCYQAHAWVTVEEKARDGAPLGTSPEGYAEAFEL